MGTATASGSQSVPESDGINPDWTFVKTPHGFIRMVQLIVVISGYISLRSSPPLSYCEKAAVHFAMYGCVSVFAISIVLVTITAFFFRLDRLCPLINLPLTVLLRDMLLTSLHLVVTILMLISSATCTLWPGSHVAVVVFSAGSLWLFAVTSYMNLQWFRQELPCATKNIPSSRDDTSEKSSSVCATGQSNPSFEQETVTEAEEQRRGVELQVPASNMPDIVAHST